MTLELQPGNGTGATVGAGAPAVGVSVGNLDGSESTARSRATHGSFASDEAMATECAVLGAMLFAPNCVQEVATIVQPADFHDPRHRLIARAILAEHAGFGTSPMLAVVARLRATGRLEECGGDAYVVNLLEQAVPWASARRYAGVVRENSVRRRMAAHAAELEQAARGGAPMAHLQELWEQARPVPAEPEVRGTVATDLLEAWRNEGPLVHVPTGIAALDAMTGGGPTLGARIYCNGAPNAGKTALALQVADTWSQNGIVVGILAIDEEPHDLLQRLLQRRGWSRKETEVRESGDLEQMGRHVAGLTIVFYSHEDTIESAGFDLARRAAAAGKPAALFVDSIQSAAAAGQDRTAAVASAVASARAVASRHRMIVWCTSEMNRNGYRSAVAAAEQNGMAAGADSRTIEFQARLLINLTSIPGDGDRIECRVVKNKLGRDHLPAEQGIVLHLNRATQELTEDTTFQVPATQKPKDAAKARQHLSDQAILAELVARSPGRGWKELEAAFRARSGGSTRASSARYALGEALVKLPGLRTAQLHYLDGGKVPQVVLDLVPAEFRGAVKAAEVPSSTEPHSGAPSSTSAPRSTPTREAHQAPIGSRCVSSLGAGADAENEQADDCRPVVGGCANGARHPDPILAKRRQSARIGASGPDDGLPEQPGGRRRANRGGAA